MIDSYELLREQIERAESWSKFSLDPKKYGVVTLHRPSNVDEKEKLLLILGVLKSVTRCVPLVFPIHPRTKQRLRDFDLLREIEAIQNLYLPGPMNYIGFMSLVQEACVVITDSGGIQEETTYLGIPCLTARETTERPITVTCGTNRLVGFEDIGFAVDEILADRWPKGRRPELWDGRTAHRIVELLKSRIGIDTM